MNNLFLLLDNITSGFSIYEPTVNNIDIFITIIAVYLVTCCTFFAILVSISIIILFSGFSVIIDSTQLTPTPEPLIIGTIITITLWSLLLMKQFKNKQQKDIIVDLVAFSFNYRDFNGNILKVVIADKLDPSEKIVIFSSKYLFPVSIWSLDYIYDYDYIYINGFTVIYPGNYQVKYVGWVHTNYVFEFVDNRWGIWVTVGVYTPFRQ